ncbi:MAG: hypothetical protein JSR98_14900 [Proteobacteria bacterium]|nr:hypothetical protein [Pseudomonadota bacterium]
MSFKTLLAGAAALALLGAGSAQAAVWTYAANLNTPGSALDASADISVSANTLVITLSNLLADTKNASQEISGVKLTFASAPTSASITSDSGTVINITGSGATGYTTTNNAITHWGTAISGGALYLATAGTGSMQGTPIDMIIGSEASYTDVNASITHNHSLTIDGPATFTLALGNEPAPVVTGVTFVFGTNPDSYGTATCTSFCSVTNLSQQVTNAVPEPAVWTLMIGGFFGAGLMLRARRRQAVSQA